MFAASSANAIYFADSVLARLAFDLDGFPPLAIEREIDVEIEVGFDPGEWVPRRLAALHVAGGDFADFMSVEGTLPDFWLDGEVFSQQAQLAVVGEHLGGVLEFLGVAYVCPGPCEDFEPIFTFPLDATGAIDPPFLSIDEAWTTGTVVSGEFEATGHNLAASVEWTDVANPWWSVSLVTPIRLVFPDPGPSLAGIARLDLRSWTPQCADGMDNEGDESVDYPDDPGCSDANDLEEGLEIYDGDEHEIDASVVPGERLYVGGSD